MMALLIALLLVLFVQSIATLRNFPRLGAALLAGAVLVFLAINSALQNRGATEEEATRYAVYTVAVLNIALFILHRVAAALGFGSWGYGSYNASLLRLPEATDPKSRELFAEGRRCEHEGKYDDALALYEELLATEPAFVKCLTAKGILHCKKGQLDQGKAVFERAAELRPDSAWVIHLLAKVEAQMGLKEAALGPFPFLRAHGAKARRPEPTARRCLRGRDQWRFQRSSSLS